MRESNSGGGGSPCGAPVSVESVLLDAPPQTIVPVTAFSNVVPPQVSVNASREVVNPDFMVWYEPKTPDGRYIEWQFKNNSHGVRHIAIYRDGTFVGANSWFEYLQGTSTVPRWDSEADYGWAYIRIGAVAYPAIVVNLGNIYSLIEGPFAGKESLPRNYSAVEVTPIGTVQMCIRDSSSGWRGNYAVPLMSVKSSTLVNPNPLPVTKPTAWAVPGKCMDRCINILGIMAENSDLSSSPWAIIESLYKVISCIREEASTADQEDMVNLVKREGELLKAIMEMHKDNDAMQAIGKVIDSILTQYAGGQGGDEHQRGDGGEERSPAPNQGAED